MEWRRKEEETSHTLLRDVGQTEKIKWTFGTGNEVRLIFTLLLVLFHGFVYHLWAHSLINVDINI